MRVSSIGTVRERDSDTKEIRIYSCYSAGLQGIENHSHLWILFWMDRLSDKDRQTLLQHPQGNRLKKKQGVFALHSPSRPNPIGLTQVTLLKRNGDALVVQGLDALDGSPVIDIKPAIGVKNGCHYK